MRSVQVVAKAADAISAGDTVSRRVRQYQDWSLAPFANVMTTGEGGGVGWGWGWG